jgi:hypothetical protein
MGTTRKAEIADPAMAGDTYVEITQLVKQRMIQMGGIRKLNILYQCVSISR